MSLFEHGLLDLENRLKPQYDFFISENQTGTHCVCFLRAASGWLITFVLCVKGSVSNIHGYEAIKSWCDYRRMINAGTDSCKNINFISNYKTKKSSHIFLLCHDIFGSVNLLK